MEWRPFAKLLGKRLIWTKYVRIFCDGGYPIWRLIPRFHRAGYNPYWKMKGFRIYWLGREFNFSFGEDTNHLYEYEKNNA